MDMTNTAHVLRAPQPASSRLDVMNFLNEIANEYPQAVSFASGRPAEEFFQFAQWIARVPQFVEHFARQRGIDSTQAYNLLAQYGRTNGIINDLMARQLELDEGVVCAPEQILVTAGCQEALDLVVTGVCRDPDDVILVRSPCYIGITGVAELTGIEMAPFTCDDGDDALAAMRAQVAQLEARGKRPRLLYLVPDFDNPTGAVLSRQERIDFIAFCADKQILILEDNPYGMFRYEGERVPTMYCLDDHGCVVYLGTYSKTICPALRIGCAAIPPALFGVPGTGRTLCDQLSQAKSFVSVNTSQLTQAVVGAMLLAEAGSLQKLVAPARALYRRNRDLMVEHLAAVFPAGSGVCWNRPEGGFFLTLTLPFSFGKREAQMCANEYGVLVMPLSFFALDDRQDRRIRLAFSNISPDAIATGVARIAQFVRDRLAQGA